MKNTLFLIITCIGLQIISAQPITAKLIDKNTQAPIPFAAIQTGAFSGIISNEEGYFTLSSPEETSSLTISSIGYSTKTLTVADIKSLNYIIALETAINQLDEVYISNKKPHVDSIIARVKRYSKKNYNSTLRQYDIFRRVADYVNFENLDFEIDKASHVKKQQLDKVNTDLQALTKAIKTSNIVNYQDLKGSLYTQTQDSSKLTVSKVTLLLDHDKDFSIDNIQQRAKNIMLRYLDTTKTYKVKTGLFKIEDSLSFAEIKKEQEKAKKEEFNSKDLKQSTRRTLKYSQFYDNSFLMNVLDTRLYDYTLDDITVYNQQLTYIISYEPRKGKAKYSGKLYVTDSDYAITKATYSYYENRHGSKLNLKLLLGVKYEENLSSGLVLYQKQSDSTYQPKYIKHESGSYFYVSRDVTLIENSKDRYKLSTDFTLEGNNRTKTELLITANNPITLNDYNAITQPKKVPYQSLKKFDTAIWGDDETLAPLQEMKAFGNEGN
ncbi:carboxypeptidase-like regulatory domain-containing protein [Confluentibacter sediminis]|uniref:carboxypeptidase-like regulatory domain-containing protein n=1 Tax=Confluentibacter sediminis TaxID=2219045 RepID=UPI000DADA807|nr:carboxypeptidase-like regulatory domain-containing protein [Confluentibacter sediminis]